MSTINLDRECGCFKRSPFENNISFESKDDAMMKAQEMIGHMNSKFCGKHGFTLSENGDDFSITMGQPAQAATSGGCCGGGHCS
ncbi:MAG: Unknown protein [uncultured Sulfurovum sp.]|uniref:Uncharacterized protein n=1 Tax=uncultured Sulfurovum sp. TaxID=269237 RepID=A0A6S6SLB7_9BACT|nr:MAG: Unknown protein [uncultured Sulfurovum sp.]